MTDKGQLLVEAIWKGEGIAVSNRSFKDTYGTAAWVVEGSSPAVRASGVVIAPGSERDHSSYCSELAGIYSTMVFVKHLCTFYHITNGSITLGCDGKSAIDKAFNEEDIIHVEDADQDLLRATRSLLLTSPLTWSFRHILGHQDTSKSLASLDRWEKLNVEMDTKAKLHLDVTCRSPRHYAISREAWSVWLNGKKIVKDLAATIYEVVHSDIAKQYWMKKDSLTEDDVEAVNWDLIQGAMKESKKRRRVFMTKHSSGNFNI
jgi:hypothetical protein